MPIDSLTVDTDCIDGSGCAPLAGTFSQQTAWTPKVMSTNIANPLAPSPVAGAS
jgi:hypothetical protein